jgi:beta-phosphoglucomutase family hydrolase
MIKAVIFDMDGTVVDSTQSDYQAMKRMFAKHGVDFGYEEFLSVLGAKGSEIVRERVDLPTDEIERMLNRKEEDFMALSEEKGLQLIPYVEELLQEIRNIPLKTALATGGGGVKQEYVFNKFGIEKYFDCIYTADKIRKGKPDPEIFLRAAEELGVPPEQCVVMEDATNGVEAARKAGMRCIAITSTHRADQLREADLVIDDYRKLNLRQFIEKYTQP